MASESSRRYNPDLPAPPADALLHGTRLVLTYRSFLNTDPPLLIDIWQKQPPLRCLSAVMTRRHLDQMVLAKPYFDPAGLIIAFEDDKPVGFVHAGFGPTKSHHAVDHATGIIAQLRIIECENQDAVAAGLLNQATDYLKAMETTTCYAGARFPYSPFYMGLYGGSRIPGIPSEDEQVIKALQNSGFEEVEKIVVMQLSLRMFRPKISRALVAIRRQYQVAAIVDPLLPNWWECCTFGWSEIFGFRVVRRSDRQVVGSVIFWDIEPLSSQWGMSTLGLVDLVITDENRRKGLATFLIGESLRHLSGQGRAAVEVQLRESDEPAIGVARRMGFEQISSGSEMKKLL